MDSDEKIWANLGALQFVGLDFDSSSSRLYQTHFKISEVDARFAYVSADGMGMPSYGNFSVRLV
jgi:hypothetical protein